MIMQMVPVEQIGKALFQNMWTEEIPHHADDCGNEDPVAKYNPPFEPPYGYSIGLIQSSAKDLAYIHLSESIPSNHSTDVVSPPPDILS